MINPFKEINWKPGREELKKFGLSLMIGFPILGVVFFFVKWLRSHEQPEFQFFLLLGGIGATVGLVCYLVPPIARLLYPIWYGIAACVGIVLANLLFTLLFYVLFGPLGIFMRLIGRDPLNLKFKRGTASYWVDAPPPRPATQYFRQY